MIFHIYIDILIYIGGEKVQNTSYKTNKNQEWTIQHDAIWYVGKLLRK